MGLSRSIAWIKAKKDQFVEWSYWGKPCRGDNNYSFYDIVVIALILFPCIFLIVLLILILGVWF
jgi:hypothetical protein